MQRWKDTINAKPLTPFSVSHTQRYEEAMPGAQWPLPRAPVFTSNVDALAQQIAHEGELMELHGDCWTWQCAARCEASAEKLWLAPRDWRFDVDDATMLCAPRRATGELRPTPCTTQLNAAQVVEAYGPVSFSSPYPTCPDCHALARPAILMFNDMLWCRKQGRHAHSLPFVS